VLVPEELTLGPVYLVRGVPAVLTDRDGNALDVRVLDKREGFEVDEADRRKRRSAGPGMVTLVAVAIVRRTQCPEDPTRWTVTFGDGASYVVQSAMRRGRMDGGEWVMSLQEA